MTKLEQVRFEAERDAALAAQDKLEAEKQVTGLIEADPLGQPGRHHPVELGPQPGRPSLDQGSQPLAGSKPAKTSFPLLATSGEVRKHAVQMGATSQVPALLPSLRYRPESPQAPVASTTTSASPTCAAAWPASTRMPSVASRFTAPGPMTMNIPTMAMTPSHGPRDSLPCQPWRGPAEHHTFASSFATQPWLLSIDADEYIGRLYTIVVEATDSGSTRVGSIMLKENTLPY